METQTTGNTTLTSNTNGANRETEFIPGSCVVYGLHGKCTVVGIEERTVGTSAIRFYKLEPQKSPLARTTRKSPAIWLPVNSAKENGLRAPMTKEEANEAMNLLRTKNHSFQLGEPWYLAHPKLEVSIKSEGGLGLAKVFNFLSALRKKQIVPTPEVTKFAESVTRSLFRELSETLDIPQRELEEQAAKFSRQRSNFDN
jgi:RNA polymerase-interacting CarD/CdnL/TRCF family regulator